MLRLTRSGLLLGFVLLLPGTLAGQDEWDRAQSEIVRLGPADFAGLPEPVARAIDAAGCGVPQDAGVREPHNVLVGRFAHWSQVDWAFLCSRGGSSGIHVLWGGDARCPTPVAVAEDRAFLQGLGGDSIGYSRGIAAASYRSMTRLQDAFGGPPVPAVWHDGLEDRFTGKASVIYLCVDGRWLILQGMD